MKQLAEKLYDWGARKETLMVAYNHKNTMILRGLCDEAADALSEINLRIYSRAVTALVEGNYELYNEMKNILKISDEEAVKLLEDIAYPEDNPYYVGGNTDVCN